MDGVPTYEGALSESQALRHIPKGLVEQIRSASGDQYLHALALAALEPRCTEWVFFAHEPLFVDLAARWFQFDAQIHQFRVIEAFSRILPFAPYLRSFASQYATSQPVPFSTLAASGELTLLDNDDFTVRSVLLSLFRLLSFDLETFSFAVSPIQLQSLFRHSDRCIRYLAIRCFCLHMHAADAATDKMLLAHMDDQPVEGKWEGLDIDYRLVGLWEEQRWTTLETLLRHKRDTSSMDDELDVEKFEPYLTNHTANIGGVLVPKVKLDIQIAESALVKTPTVLTNLQNIAKSLLRNKPLLLVGLPNSGKTSLVNDIARATGQWSSMVTLHLNEQTDAKSLLGMYATSSMTGAFAWQPGVLTKAAREGRWILIEDLDRAPSEVIGLILPIIERGELIIPSRKERIKCADGFRIFATMRSSLDNKGDEIAPGHSLLGIRLWDRIRIASLSLEEISHVISQKFPLLSSRVPTLMEIYDRLCSAFTTSLTVRSSQGRTPGFRDLIKLCSRLHRRLLRLGFKTGDEPAPENLQDEMFLDAVDVLLRYLPDRDLCGRLSSVAAEVLQLSPQQAQYCLHSRIPPYSDRDNTILVGRETCTKMKVSKTAKAKYLKNSSRFAPTRAALKIMEQIAAAVEVAEPVLLVGETGIGKTAVVQQLSNLMRQQLTVVNLSQQSESTDLLGGFRPVNLRSLAVPLLDEFNLLFEQTFSAKKNQKFLSSVTKSVTAGNWARLVHLWHEAVRMAQGVFRVSRDTDKADHEKDEQPAKKRKLDSPKYQALKDKWDNFETQLKEFEAQATRGDSKFAFAFVQGKIVRALRNGEWVLLDEINLASPDILENVASLLHHGDEGRPSVLLSEAGDVERVYGHPDFRIFGAMNPATDAGKRDLAPGLRSRFTEVYVQSPDTDFDDLLGLIQTYLGDLTRSDHRVAADLAHLYLETKKLNAKNQLTDGVGQKPHFSIRTLVRTLIYIVDHVQIYGIRRAAYEGFCMSFLTLLSQESEKIVVPLIERHIFGSTKNARSLLGQTPKSPNDGNEYVQFKHYWMRKGPFKPEGQAHYIITPFIEKNLKNLLRASSTRRFPILLQGPTSSGKTSMVEYLAKISGNKFLRINNHEHTDLQEYLGTYISTDDGSLRYQEGVLVEALRHGYWIVLDELNLAPSDVLEALNRLLDDNRELFLPETQEVIHPHPNFMLFATQNPAGLYGGRKVLSRAFRNRFLELHFDDIPEDELEYILKERTQIAPSFCARIVTVYKKLSLLRQTTRLFEQKNSFATLRDLFRWALRRADDRETLAVNGFMLLAERVRNAPERAAVKQVIEDVMRVRIDEDAIYSSEELERRVKDVQDANNLSRGVVWTKAMRRVFILVSQALENNEPVLLVGETGCGKTQICQAVAEIHRKDLFIVNAHVNLETGDLIGAQRPVRNRAAIDQQLYDDLRTLLHATPKLNTNLEGLDLEQLKATFFQLDLEQLEAADTEVKQRIKINLTRSQALFEWSDGSLITAMKTGQYFLLDEVSLADDSVLERLNSVLEPHRSLLLAEKGPVDSLVVAHEGFQFVSTMNPGGDYGKRELSAALRNRLTEIWVPQLSEDEDILPILVAKLNVQDERSAKAMLDFAKWFKQTFQNSSATSVSIRDLLAWVEFINKCPPSEPEFALVHGAAMVYIDTLGANPSAMLSMAPESLGTNRALCIQKLTELFGFDAGLIYNQSSTVSVQNGNMCVGPFILPMSSESMPDPQFVMDAPTTVANSVRIARGLQLSKPILLEGSPGVGKTTLVASLARALGKPLTRINLSEQTDLTDLFGSDVPVEGGTVGQFAWRDAPFLQAMQRGDWVLLDEMNLASQSVLEGLNSCLDHRQQVYVAELDQTFKRHPEFVLFAAQNPHHQGGGRKGLPASFVNRFTVVYADCFSDVDLKRICSKLFPANEQIEQVVDFVSRLNVAINFERKIGAVGGPWEMNLRDITRWLQLADCEHISSGHFLDNIISHRFRTEDDRILISQVFKQSFGELPPPKSYYHDLSWDQFQVGLGFMQRDPIIQNFLTPTSRVLPRDLPIFESLILCIERAWPSILVGASGCGKTTTIRKLAALNGAHLVELALSADTDTMDLIGGFEQIDHRRQIASLAKDLKTSLHNQIISSLIAGDFSSSTLSLLQIYETCKTADISVDKLLSSVSFLKNNYPAFDNAKLLHRCNLLAQMSQNSRKVGFEWTEGALTEAIQHGHWVVLDNANLCNPSVLDRLNSLMEPNGYLVLNEQRTEDSSARVVVPHPNFRLFLTMDPRNGELSRAMRNRSVEICFLPQHLREIADSTRPTYLSQSVLYRLRHMWKLHEAAVLNKFDDNSVNVCLDHLAISDLDRFRDSIEKFACTSANFDSKPFISTLERYISVMEESSDWKMALEYRNTDWRGSLVTIHPLVNEPRLTALPMSLDPMTILGYLQELKLDLHRLQQNLSKAESNSQQLKPSQMTKLERSLSSRRIAALMKDPTQPVGEFLRDCLQILHRFIQSLDRTTAVSRQMLSALVAIYRFCYDIFTITQSKDMDEEEFQTYLQIGQDIQSSAIGQTLLLNPLILDVGRLLARFQSTWALKTGLSMQRIWESWRPITCVEKFQLECLLDLEETISEFTHVALQTRLSLPQLSMVRKLLVDAQRSIVRDQADGKILLQGLKQQVKDFKSAADIYSLSQPPHFTDIFETLCRYHDLPSIWYPSAVDEIESLSDTVQLLAGRAAHPLSASNLQSSVPGILQKLSLYRGSETSSSASSAFSESFSLSLLQRLGHVNDVTLGRLEFLENEQLVLAKAVARSSHEISLNQAGLLSRAFARICLEIIDLHQDFLEAQISELTTQALKEVEQQGQYEGPAVPQLLPVQTLSEQHYFREYVEEISKCVQILTTPNGNSGSDLFNMGLVSVQLAVICLRLFVPDKQYDPSLGLVIQRRRHAEHVLQLTAKEQALMKFEVEFSGQQGNLRRALVQQELQDLGSEPPAPPVTRPNKSQLTQLQGEFSNLITSVLSRKPEEYGPSEFRDYAHLLRNNINQICRRLRLGFRFYDDITILVTRFLEMLDLGMSLSLSVVAGVSNSTSIQRISDMTPFLGGGKHPLLRADPSGQNSSLDLSLDVQLQELSILVAAHSADLSTLKTPSGLQAISDIFHHSYTIWKTQLRDEQKEEAERTQMYRYRGSFEDNEEIDEAEFQALFPNYETAPESSDQSRLDPRSFSLKLSQLHSAIFAPGDGRTRLREFIVESARLLGSHSSQMGSSSAKLPPKSHLPGILLLLTDDMKKFEQVPLRSYNFYSDPNVAQAKKLVSLVLSTQSRFIQLQTSWPEHAAIQDVLVCCEEILQFKHIEPVAKFLTKVEKLHALVYEWQLVASREFSTTTLFDSITTLIINWRRLELSTWAKLLDLEYEKCEQEASSWWFVAYEVLMAVPFQMIESGEDLTRYINETVATFENFFKSTTMGQYSARLRLVELFMLLLVLYGADYPVLKPLVSALDNFLQHYRAFESVISKSLENGRKSLENDVKQQIQLASWKDTNITALRESAKRSHYKLFKYVRKYRALLSQPVESILQQGMPEYHDVIPVLAKGETMVAPSSGSTQAIAICREHDALWIDRAPRFRDPTATASSMLRVYASSLTEFDITAQFGTFVADVIESIKDFKSQTPGTLTEENKDNVQHLKTQKRRFYADTLRQLHVMGVRRNVSTAVLEEQASVSQILATTPSLRLSNSQAAGIVKSSDSYFHNFLDLLPRVRQASRDYNEDLNPVEVTRSIGSAEGFLWLIRKQREFLCPAISASANLSLTSDQMRHMWKSRSHVVQQKNTSQFADREQLVRCMAWLIPLLDVGTEIVEIHSKLSGRPSISQTLQGWRDNFADLQSRLARLPDLPAGISLQSALDISQEAIASLNQLKTELSRSIQERPDLSFVLEQIDPWISIAESTNAVMVNADLAVEAWSDEYLSTVDRILVALQALKNTLSLLPSSTDDKDWLSRTDSILIKAVQVLHMSEISACLTTALDKMQFLELSGTGPTLACAIIGSLLPITDQYLSICDDLLARYLSLHREVCKMSYVLSKSFTQVASEGFCSPSEASTEESKSGKVESGTGLGDGEGAEDISKDVQDDEDLTDLAQQENTEQSGQDIDQSREAVDMDQEDLEGDFDKDKEDVDGDESDSEEGENDDEIDDEVGSVDDLDPTAVDEKLWDGSHEDDQKETENEEGKGISESDKQAASNEKKEGEQQQDGDEPGDDEEEPPEDEGEAVGREEMDVTDPHAKEEQTLDLPEEMQLDGEEKEDAGSDMDDGLDDLSDLGQEVDEEQTEHGQEETMGDESTANAEDIDIVENGEDENAEGEDKGEAEQAGDEEPAEDEPEQQDIMRSQRDDSDAAENNIAPSEAVSGGMGADQDFNEEQGTSGDAQQEGGSKDAGTEERPNGAAEDGQDRQKAEDTAGGTGDDAQENPQAQAFKKLGDVLEQWHRRQREIMNSTQAADSQTLPPDTNMDDAEFEHLADEDDAADTQALGQASEEQAKALDQNKGVESEAPTADNELLPVIMDDEKPMAVDKTLEEAQMDIDSSNVNDRDGVNSVGSITRIGERTGESIGVPSASEELEEVDSQLAAIHLSSALAPRTSGDEARRLWSHYEAATNNLSLSLTEQLRLILAPTLATKLRGDFRTGKRLNIKRIIPYIASQYKRDKIWMRRSIPSKRNYQIMLAVDDSKSMMESGSGQLAFETLALVARSLSMLEAGDLCVVGFGDEEHVRVAHEFGKPFSSEAGIQVFQQFSYQQTGTNVRKLVADSIALFREARARRSGGGSNSADLWQLELIISDGICEDHDTIRRLVRQAQEERIMIVFIILDAAKGSSILDLTQASFEPDDSGTGTGEMKLKMKRYLEGFPFAYYLVVRDVRELPAVLAMALKQWFAEVVDSSA